MAHPDHILCFVNVVQRSAQWWKWTCLVLLAGLCFTPPCAAEEASSSGKSAPAQPALVVTPNEFEGSDSERINRAIEVASESGARVVVPRVNVRGREKREVWLLDSAILLRNNTILELDNCHIKLSDRCRDNVIRSANCGMGISNIEPMRNIHIRGIGRPILEGADRPRATGGADKKLGAETFGTDAGVAGESQNGDWRNIGVLLVLVENYSVENIQISESHGLALSMERCAYGMLRDIDIASAEFKVIDGVRRTLLNRDGIEVTMGCHDISLTNITGHSGDDLVAFCAIPLNEAPGATASMMASGSRVRQGRLDDVHDIIVRNIQGYCQGGHHIVRLLNTPGIRMYNILIDGLIDTSPPEIRCRAAIKIGDHTYGGGMAPLGDTSRIIINNVISRSTCTILIGGSLSDSIINNIVRYDVPGDAVTFGAGPEHVRDVTMTNIRVVGK